MSPAGKPQDTCDSGDATQCDKLPLVAGPTDIAADMEEIAAAAKSILNDFSGSIFSSSHDEHGDVKGLIHDVIRPYSAQDVTSALRLSDLLKLDLQVRSGTRRGTSVESTMATTVLRLDNLKGISVVDAPNNIIGVEPGATMQDLADALKTNNLFLPLVDNPTKSVIGAVYDKDTTPLLARSQGSLKDFVDAFDLSTADGIRKLSRASADPTFTKVLNGEIDRKTVVTRIYFRAIPAAAAAPFWLFHASSPLDADLLPRLQQLLNLGLGAVPAKTDVGLRIRNADFGHPVVVITAAGVDSGSSATLSKAIVDALTITTTQRDGAAAAVPADSSAERIRSNLVRGIDILHEIVGPLGVDDDAERSLQREEYRLVVAPEAFPSDNFIPLISNLMRSNPRPLSVFKIRKTADEKAHVFAFIFMSGAPTASEQATRDQILQVLHIQKTIEPATVVRASASAPRALRTENFARINLVSLASPPPSDDEKQLRDLNFKGDIFTQSHSLFNDKRRQYASSSYPDEKLKPYMVLYPEDAQSVSVAILFAQNHVPPKKIVARSGGHSYSGLSSGGADTIVLSMDCFNERTANGNIATIGVGNHLTDIAAFLNKNGITVPHGECPLVCIGGHVQTGGYGHLLRSYGNCLDFCSGFQIVTADGVIRDIRRPALGSPSTFESELYWGVMGGGPNSFGVLTKVELDAIRDIDHPNSTGFKATYWYSKKMFRAAMKEVQAITKQLNDPAYPDDIDLCITVRSSEHFVFPPPLLLVELVFGDNNTDQSAKERGREILQGIIDRIEKEMSFLHIHDHQYRPDEHHPLSFMSDSFVRRYPATTKDGREFKYPYHKRLNITQIALSDEFVDGFVDLVDETIHTDGAYLIFQEFTGGGRYKKNGDTGLTALPFRDATNGVVYDVFYTNEQNALKLQKKMEALLPSYNGGKDLSMYWGTYGTPLDIRKTWPKYIGDEAKYKRLIALKNQVDKNDVFHTELTIPLSP